MAATKETRKHSALKKSYSLRLNTVTYREKIFLGTTTFSQSFLLSCYFTKTFVHLSVVAAVCYFSVYKLIGRNQANKYLFKVISRNTRKRRAICRKLTINTVESHSGVFIVNFKHISHFFRVSFVDFEQVNISRGLFLVQIKLPKVKMRRCFI